MGGFGSGRRRDWSRDTVEDRRSIDVNRLRREGCLVPGWQGGWNWSRDGETVASIGASLALPEAGGSVVGLEINANHLRPVRDGVLTAVATPLHQGRRTQVWAVEIRDAASRLVCTSRCTLAVLQG